jgi:predicted glycogen debranching enzyme
MLGPGSDVTLVVSTEEWDAIRAMTPEEASRAEQVRCERLLDNVAEPLTHGFAAELVLAADQFLIVPVGRASDPARARAMGDEARTVVAGYHWFTDWGRDTMISLEGLTLTTGRVSEAGYLLRTFAHHVKDGLIPNMFPEGEQEGLYHTADATLWFIHALYRYLDRSHDLASGRAMIPLVCEILDAHLRGTRFGIGVDCRDGLLVQGEAGYQLTWMDAKVDGWVVTPRRGKAVEINALWFNALSVAVKLLEEEVPRHDSLSRYRDVAAQAKQSFNERFWYEPGGYLYDVVDGETGDDAALRPNQVIALSLDFPVLESGKWTTVVDTVEKELLTPVGLRTLARRHPDYRSTYFGNLHSRDAAYHQGTVWAWLIGPFVDARLRAYPGDVTGAVRCLEGFKRHLSEACVGSISEIFDAEPPFTPRGCIAQAWSVAEVLRSLERCQVLQGT